MKHHLHPLRQRHPTAPQRAAQRRQPVGVEPPPGGAEFGTGPAQPGPAGCQDPVVDGLGQWPMKKQLQNVGQFSGRFIYGWPEKLGFNCLGFPCLGRDPEHITQQIAQRHCAIQQHPQQSRQRPQHVDVKGTGATHQTMPQQATQGSQDTWVPWFTMETCPDMSPFTAPEGIRLHISRRG